MRGELRPAGKRQSGQGKASVDKREGHRSWKKEEPKGQKESAARRGRPAEKGREEENASGREGRGSAVPNIRGYEGQRKSNIGSKKKGRKNETENVVNEG